jgi:uncharacterized protein
VDNGATINAIQRPQSSQLTATVDVDSLGGVVAIRGKVKRDQLPDSDALYQIEPLTIEEIDLQAVPFCFWANRGAGEMRVWIQESP